MITSLEIAQLMRKEQKKENLSKKSFDTGLLNLGIAVTQKVKDKVQKKIKK